MNYKTFFLSTLCTLAPAISGNTSSTFLDFRRTAEHELDNQFNWLKYRYKKTFTEINVIWAETDTFFPEQDRDKLLTLVTKNDIKKIATMIVALKSLDTKAVEDKELFEKNLSYIQCELTRYIMILTGIDDFILTRLYLSRHAQHVPVWLNSLKEDLLSSDPTNCSPATINNIKTQKRHHLLKSFDKKFALLQKDGLIVAKNIYALEKIAPEDVSQSFASLLFYIEAELEDTNTNLEETRRQMNKFLSDLESAVPEKREFFVDAMIKRISDMTDSQKAIAAVHEYALKKVYFRDTPLSTLEYTKNIGEYAEFFLISLC